MILLIHNFNKLEVYLCYQINIKYISSVLCENKNNPDLHCNGKCYMKKKLKSLENNQQQFPHLFKEFQKINYFISNGIQVGICLKPSQIIVEPTVIQKKILSPVFSIFHPPPFVS